MMNSETNTNEELEKLASIVAEHERVSRRQWIFFRRLGGLSFFTLCLCFFSSIFYTGPIPFLKPLLWTAACLSAGWLIFMISFMDWYRVPGRRDLVTLMRFTEDDDDARELLRSRLLSGKLLTGRDENEIKARRHRNMEARAEADMRRQERTVLREFTGREKQK